MKLETAFARALEDAGAARVRGVDVKALSDYFLARDGAATPWHEPWAAPAYLAYFLPLNYVRLRAALREVARFVPAARIGAVVDHGSGSGATHFALEDQDFLSPREIYCVEIAAGARAAHRELAERRAGRWTPRFEKPTGLGEGALGIFSYSFLEMAPDVNQLKPFDHLLIIEPSTRARGRALMEFRQRLLGAGYRALAPCTHDRACPLLTESPRDWCHHRVTFDPPGWWAALEDELPMKNRTLTFSYLLVSRAVGEVGHRDAARVIGDALIERGKTRQMVCRGRGREFLSWLHRDGTPPAVPRDALIDGCDTTESKGPELRVTRASRLEVTT